MSIDKNNPDFENETFRAYFPDNIDDDVDTEIPITVNGTKYTLINFNIIRDKEKNVIFAYKFKDNEEGTGKYVLYYLPEPAHERSKIFFKVFKEVCPIDDYLDVRDTFKSTLNEMDGLKARLMMKGKTAGSGKLGDDK